MLEKTLYNNLTTKKISFFKSQYFSITFTPNWRQKRKLINRDIADFINLDDDIGILQISSFINEDDNFHYDIKKAKAEIDSKGYPSKIVNVSIYKSVVCAIKYEDENLFQFRFEFGNKNKRVFITLTFKNVTQLQIDSNYNQIIKILDTLKFI